MSIELTPACMDKPLFLRMAKDYTETLAIYDKRIRWDEGAWTSEMWHAKFIMEDRIVQGFLIIKEERFDFYPPAMYIQEFYVVPESRGRGIGLEAVKEALGKWDKDIFFYGLKSNVQAAMFWMAVADKLNWRRIRRPEIREESGCRLAVYQAR